jgi:hypothetical protein
MVVSIATPIASPVCYAIFVNAYSGNASQCDFSDVPIFFVRKSTNWSAQILHHSPN